MQTHKAQSVSLEKSQFVLQNNDQIKVRVSQGLNTKSITRTTYSAVLDMGDNVVVTENNNFP